MVFIILDMVPYQKKEIKMKYLINLFQTHFTPQAQLSKPPHLETTSPLVSAMPEQKAFSLHYFLWLDHRIQHKIRIILNFIKHYPQTTYISALRQLHTETISKVYSTLQLLKGNAQFSAGSCGQATGNKNGGFSYLQAANCNDTNSLVRYSQRQRPDKSTQRRNIFLNIRFAQCLMIVALSSATHQQFALGTIITFYLQKYPYFKKRKTDQQFIDHISKKVQQPGYLTGKIIKSHTYSPGVPGVMCMYAGHIALSDEKGQIVFPRLQNSENPHVNLLVTKGLKPAYILAPATVYGWQIDPAQPTKMYHFQLKQNQETQLYYFEATEKTAPKNNGIPLDTIIIISEPENVFIPLGATITDYSSNLTLPNIYIKKEFCFIYNSFYTLAIKQYFRQTDATFQQEGLTVSMIQQPNI